MYPMGTDAVGRDVLARTVYGGQISLAIAGLAVTITTVVGTTLGEIAGYGRGWLDSIIMRYTEAQLSIPLLFLLLVLSKFIGNKLPEVQFLGNTVSGSVFVIILVLGFTSWMGLARIVRANRLSLKNQEFVIAARVVGSTTSGSSFDTSCRTRWRQSSSRRRWGSPTSSCWRAT